MSLAARLRVYFSFTFACALHIPAAPVFPNGTDFLARHSDLLRFVWEHPGLPVHITSAHVVQTAAVFVTWDS